MLCLLSTRFLSINIGISELDGNKATSSNLSQQEDKIPSNFEKSRVTTLNGHAVPHLKEESEPENIVFKKCKTATSCILWDMLNTSFHYGEDISQVFKHLRI